MNGEVGTNVITDSVEEKQKQLSCLTVHLAKLNLLPKTDENTEEQAPVNENNQTFRYDSDNDLELDDNFEVKDCRRDTKDQLSSDQLKNENVKNSNETNSEDLYSHDASINECEKKAKIEENCDNSDGFLDYELSGIQYCKKQKTKHNDSSGESDLENVYELYQSKTRGQCEEDIIKAGFVERNDSDILNNDSNCLKQTKNVGPQNIKDFNLNDTLNSDKKSDYTDSEDINNHVPESHIKKSDDTESNYSPENGESISLKPSRKSKDVNKKSKVNTIQNPDSEMKTKNDHSDDDNMSVGNISLNLDDSDIDLLKTNELLSTDNENSLLTSQTTIDSSCVGRGKYKCKPPLVEHIKNGNTSPSVYCFSSYSSEEEDCVITSVKVQIKKPVKKRSKKESLEKSKLRRSSRAVQKKVYIDRDEDIDDDDDESYFEIEIQDSSKHNLEDVPNDEITRKKSKAMRKTDKNPISVTTNAPKSKVKSVSKKARSSTKPTSLKLKSKDTPTEPTPIPKPPEPMPPEPILPTLTDDMFVVEAPSFIIPYVYEKPAQISLKKFVENLGKELKEEEMKQELKLKEKQKAEKAQREKETQERREKEETVSDSDNKEEKSEIVDMVVKKVRKRRKEDDEDDVSWDGSSSEESNDESSDDSQKDMIDDLPEVTPVATLPVQKGDSYFDLTLGKFFINIGSNLVQEYVQTDLLNEQKKKLKREKKARCISANREFSVAQLTKNLEETKKMNESYKMVLKRCKFCNFKTESELVLKNHLEFLHMRNNKYCCTYCPMEMQNQFKMILHMQNDHNVRARYDPPLCANQCTLCLFEVQGKSKLGRHIENCTKKFKPEVNLAPPLNWEHPAKIPKLIQKRSPAPYQMAQFPQLSDLTAGCSTNVRMPIGNALTSPTFRPRSKITPPRPPRVLAKNPALHEAVKSTGEAAKNASTSIIIGPAPRPDGPTNSQSSNAKDIVMCEICDGYIQHLEQLRNHMQWVHKIKIHPKMILNRPPLNCQKCHSRFFSDQGLERHLLGAHGLVTSAIQENANKGKDAGRCPVCGLAYQRNLLAHVSRDHNLTLKPANLSYKCTVCMATFSLYSQFESHVYSAHAAVSAKKDSKKPPTGETVKGKTTNLKIARKE